MKAWSRGVMWDMWARSGLRNPFRADLAKLNDVEYNEIGDWLYYHTHPEETDCRRNREIPVFIKERMSRND